jgi:hypothetical protein
MTWVTNRDLEMSRDLDVTDYTLEEIQTLADAARNGEFINYHDTELDDMAACVRLSDNSYHVDIAMSRIDDRIRQLEAEWNEMYYNLDNEEIYQKI